MGDFISDHVNIRCQLDFSHSAASIELLVSYHRYHKIDTDQFCNDFNNIPFVLSPGFIYLFGVLRRFQQCTGHITMGSWKGRGNQYIEFIRVLYCKLPTNGKQLPAFPLEAVPGSEPRPQRWEARVLPLCYRGPYCLQGELPQKFKTI